VSGKKLTELCPDASPQLQALLDQCLKPNPAERPAGAIEVYLRLQELGKASGILLLPPGAMDKLVASRQVQTPTVVYTPKDRSRPTHPCAAAKRNPRAVSSAAPSRWTPSSTRSRRSSSAAPRTATSACRTPASRATTPSCNGGATVCGCAT